MSKLKIKKHDRENMRKRRREQRRDRKAANKRQVARGQ
jgi:hypothetical protein